MAAKPDSPARHATTAASHGDGEVHDDHPTRRTFFTIFAILTFLTVVEVAVPEVFDSEWNRSTKMLLLVGLAVGKALLVALYFMHLKWERPWLRHIAAMPVYMGIFAVLLMIEHLFRPLVP